jgi:hypothetical protein
MPVAADERVGACVADHGRNVLPLRRAGHVHLQAEHAVVEHLAGAQAQALPGGAVAPDDVGRVRVKQVDRIGHVLEKQAPKMWGPSIVGYGSYSYRYDSGRTGESCLTGFAVRGRELVVYLVADSPGQQALLERLGPYKMGKACLYIKRLADLDLAVLEALVSESVAEVKRRHPPGGAA